MKTIDEMTIGEMKQRLAEADEIRAALNLPGAALASTTTAHEDDHWKVGKNYAIRTVTHHLVGKLVKVSRQELVLVDAAWVADDGRFNEFITKGTANEVEPFPEGLEVNVGRGSLIDAVEWRFPLLRSVK